jgi:hypothetical protein
MRLKVKYVIILWHVIAGVCEMLTTRIVLSWLARDVHAHAYTAVRWQVLHFPFRAVRYSYHSVNQPIRTVL